jgi:hypothetical protein
MDGLIKLRGARIPQSIIATGYGLDDRGVGVRVSVGSRIFSSRTTGSGAHPASYPMGTGGSFPGGEAAGA